MCHLVGCVMMRVEKSKRSRLILRRFRTSSSSSVTRIRSWSWPPRTFWGRGRALRLGRGFVGGGAGSDLCPALKATVPTVQDGEQGRR